MAIARPYRRGIVSSSGSEQRPEEEHAHPEASDAKPEVQKDDADADGNAIGDDPDPPHVAVVALVEVAACGAVPVRLVPADEERAFAAMRAVFAPAAADGLTGSAPEIWLTCA